MQRIITITLLMVFLLPMLAMSKGNEEALARHEAKKERFLKGYHESIINGNEITYRKGEGRIQWLFKDELTRLYLISIFLKHGENSLKVSTLLNHMSYVSMFENKYPVTYKDIFGNEYTFTKDGFIEQLKGLLKSDDPNVKISSCRALVGLDYIDDDIYTILKYYANGTDIDTWDITSGPRYINGITGAKKEEWKNPSKEKQNQCREDMQIAALYTLHKVGKEKYSDEIKELFNKLLSKNPAGHLKKRLQEYLKNLENTKDGSFNYFENSKPSKLSKEYLAIWKPDSSKSYCEKYWGPDEEVNYNHADYTEMAKDCANFGSQCLIAGGLSLSDATNGIHSTHPCGEITVVNCDDLNSYLVNTRTDIKSFTIDFTTQSQAVQEDPHGQIPAWFRTGDIALMGQSGIDNWEHTIINHGGNGTDAYFACHTAPRHEEHLDLFVWINFIDGESFGSFDYITFYHIIGSTVLVEPSKEELTVSLGDTLNLKALVTNNTEPTSLNEITNFKFDLKKKPANTLETLFSTTNQPSAVDSTYVFDFETALQDTGLYVLIAETTYAEGTTIDSCILKIKPIPEILSPLPDDLYPIKPINKATIVTDTLDIKVRVPMVSGGYPEIKLKIDDVYVNQSDIFLDDSIYVYPWDLGTVTSDPDGKRLKIEAELLDDPNCSGVSSVFTVEAVFLENFQDVTDLEAEGWNVTEYAYPLYTCAANGWMIGPDPTYVAGEKSGRTYSTNSTSFVYQLYTPAFTVPDSSEHKTKLVYKLWFKYLMIPYSYLYFDVCDASGTPLTTSQMLGPAYNMWTYMNYDLSDYSNQTIKLRWKHNYTDGMQNCYFTQYAIDNVVVYGIPDMDYPNIDFISGNQANVNEDMQIQLTFNDESDIENVTAYYEIEDDADTITLTPGKNSYSYTGTIPARDHECYGDIVFTVKDIIGNEIISDTYDIYWIEGGTQILTAPENLQIITENDSTVTLEWNAVPGASEYKVYTSEDPYGAFSLDSTGTFITSTQWQKNTDATKKFYYIVAANTSKKKNKIEIEQYTKDIDYRVK